VSLLHANQIDIIPGFYFSNYSVTLGGSTRRLSSHLILLEEVKTNMFIVFSFS